MQCVASVPTCGTFPGLPRSLEEGEKVQTVPNVARPSQQRKSSLSLGPVLLSALLPFKSWGARLGRRAGGRSQDVAPCMGQRLEPSRRFCTSSMHTSSPRKDFHVRGTLNGSRGEPERGFAKPCPG